jgi:hypothetical protein
MKNKQKTWQKSVYYLGITSFIISIVCLIFLYFKIDELGWKNAISASIMATSFFLASVGLVLITIGKCNLPSLKVDNADS